VEEFIKTLYGLKCQLIIGPSEIIGCFEVKIIKLDEDFQPVREYHQALPVDDHSYQSKVLDCAQFCLDKVLSPVEEQF